MRTRIFSTLIAAGLALVAAPVAHAGSYTVYGCQTAAGALVPMNAASGWQFSTGTQPFYARAKDYCPSSAIVGIIPNIQVPQGEIASETFTAPPGMTIKAFTFWRAVRLNPGAGYVYGEAVNSANIGWSGVEGCAAINKCGTYGNYNQPTASVNHEPVTPPPGTTQVRLEIACVLANGCPSQPVTNEIWLFKTAELLVDNVSPQITQPPSGSLVSGGVLTGTQSVSIGATDTGSGVYEAEIEVDGKVLQTQILDNSMGTCKQPWTATVPCPANAAGTLQFNTAQLPDGTHSVRILVNDPAGNVAASAPFQITTSNDPCSPIPAVTGMAVRAGFAGVKAHAGKRANSITMSYRAHHQVVGTLVNSNGTPVANATVCVSDQADAAGSAMRQVASLQTDASGGFTYLLPRGPSRTLYFIHRVPGGAVATSLHVYVHAPVHVHLNSTMLANGQTMTWTGRLPAPAPGGLIGLMQVWRGTYWQTFQSVPIAHNGRWAAAYRFSRTTGCQAYVFRMVVPHQSHYPYAAGHSGRLDVHVAGPGTSVTSCGTTG